MVCTFYLQTLMTNKFDDGHINNIATNTEEETKKSACDALNFFLVDVQQTILLSSTEKASARNHAYSLVQDLFVVFITHK